MRCYGGLLTTAMTTSRRVVWSLAGDSLSRRGTSDEYRSLSRNSCNGCLQPTRHSSAPPPQGKGNRISLRRSIASIPATRLHLCQQSGSRPAIELQPVALLIFAEGGARQHPGLAVDLVVIIAARGEDALHAVEIGSGKLRDLAPRGCERPRVENAVGQMADKQNIQIGEIVFLDGEVVLRC